MPREEIPWPFVILMTPVLATVTFPLEVVALMPLPAVTEEIPPPAPVITCPFRVSDPTMLAVPVTVRVALLLTLPKITVGADPLGASTSSVAPGVVVPMPTLVLRIALLKPAMPPRTRESLAPTREFEPIAVALLIPPVAASAPAPRKVLLLVVIGAPSAVCPANTPNAVLKLPAVLLLSELKPLATLLPPVVSAASASQPLAVLPVPGFVPLPAKPRNASLLAGEP